MIEELLEFIESKRKFMASYEEASSNPYYEGWLDALSTIKIWIEIKLKGEQNDKRNQ